MPDRIVTSTWLFLLTVATNLFAAEKPTRFVALTANGARVRGDMVSAVTAPAVNWQLDKQTLFDPTNPMRWLRDRTLLPGAPPPAYLEMTTGDCLPGAVVRYDDGSRRPFDPEPPHFVVRPETPLAPPQPARDSLVRIAARFVRKIVWQRRDSGRFQPSTVFFRDGRTLAFRSIRFGESGLTVLTSEGQRKADYHELAEVHLAVGEFWDSYFDELAGLCPQGTGRLIQLDGVDGLLVTTSRDRLRLHTPGGPQDATRWVHGCQPVWSLDALWVPQSNIWMIRSWEATEVSFSRLAPEAVRQQGWLTSQGTPHRVNRNVQQGLLRTGGVDHGWGFGVQASSSLQFTLPPAAATFRTGVGLDRAAGRGGCVRARVLVNDDVRFDSGFIIGSEIVSDSGVIPLSGLNPESCRLTLEIDAAHDGRPTGADPFDIRDLADWVDPLLTWDAVRLAPEIARRVTRHWPAWQGWTHRILPLEDAAATPPSVEWTWIWDELAPAPGRFLPALVLKSGRVVLERELTVGTADHWFLSAVSQTAPAAPPANLEVAIDGEPVAEAAVVVRNTAQRDPPPLITPLDDYRGRKIQVRSQVTSASATPTPLVWRVLRPVAQLPTLYRVFEDDLPAPRGGNRVPAPIPTDRFAGARCLEIPAGDPIRLALDAPVSIRDLPTWGEYRYVRFVVRKAGEGRFAVEFSGNEARERPARLDGGIGEPVGGSATRIYQAKLPDQWLALPHDLFGSFGRIDVSDVLLSAPDGQQVRFDSIYFGRTLADFDTIPQTLPLPPLAADVKDETLQAALTKVAPAIVQVEWEGGKPVTGVAITADGDVLVPARNLPAPNQPVKVRWRDGRTAAGQTRGASRAFDVGLVKVTDAGPWPIAELATQPTLPLDLPYLVWALKADPAKTAPLDPVRTRRQFRGTVWTARGKEAEFVPGRPLIDPAGRVAGFASREHADGVLYVRLHEVPGVLARLRNGEVW